MAYWFITIVSPVVQDVKLSILHDDDAYVWNNGVQVAGLNGYGEGQSPAFGLVVGLNNMFFKLNENMGGNQFSARIVNATGADVTGLAYYLPLASEQVGQTPRLARTTQSRLSRIMVSSGMLRISVHTAGAHAVSVLDARGRTVGAMSQTGAAEYVVDREVVGPGAFLVKIRAGKSAECRWVVLQ